MFERLRLSRGAAPDSAEGLFPFAIFNPLRFSHLSVLQLAHWICSRCPQFAPFTGRCSFRLLWNPQSFIVFFITFRNPSQLISRWGPSPIFLQYLYKKFTSFLTLCQKTCICAPVNGELAERLGRGLQILLQRFESVTRLPTWRVGREARQRTANPSTAVRIRYSPSDLASWPRG